MGATLLGFWAFALCAVPHAVATNNLVLKLLLAGIAVLPLMILAAPAKVSSSCDGFGLPPSRGENCFRRPPVPLSTESIADDM